MDEFDSIDMVRMAATHVDEEAKTKRSVIIEFPASRMGAARFDSASASSFAAVFEKVVLGTFPRGGEA